MRKSHIIITLTLLQIFFLGAMIWFQKTKIRNSRLVVLKTVPYDTYSIFRGFYANLRYEISSIDENLIKDGKENKFKGGEEVFVKLKKSQDAWVVDSAYLKKPNDDSIYIRGRVPNFAGFLDFDSSSRIIDLDYGIESFFLNEKSAKDLDNLNRPRGMDWKERDALRLAAVEKLNPETKRIYNAGIRGYYFDKFFKGELPIWVKEGIISEEAKSKVLDKYEKAFAEIKTMEDSLAQMVMQQRNKEMFVEVAIDNLGYARALRLIVDGKEYR